MPIPANPPSAQNHIERGGNYARGGNIRAARKEFEQALKDDPQCIVEVVRQCYNSPDLELSKTFVKRALTNPHVDAELRPRFVWDLSFIRAGLGRTTVYDGLYRAAPLGKPLPVNPRLLLAQFEGTARAIAQQHAQEPVSACLLALRQGFLRQGCFDFERAAHARNEETLGAEQAAMYHAVADVVGPLHRLFSTPPVDPARPPLGLEPAEQRAAVLACIRWGDTEGLDHLLNAGVPMPCDPEVANMLVNPPSMDLRLAWLGVQSPEAERLSVLRDQNKKLIQSALIHQFPIELLGEQLLIQPKVNESILEELLGGITWSEIRGSVEVSYEQRLPADSRFLARAVQEGNISLVKLMKRFGDSSMQRECRKFLEDHYARMMSA